MRRWATAAAALLSLLLLGQAPPPPSWSFPAPVFGKQVGPWRLGVSVAEGRHPGREIPVYMHFENTGPSVLGVAEGSELYYDAALVDERGAAVPLTAHAQRVKGVHFPTVGHVWPVAPGATKKQGFLLNAEFDTSLAGRYRLIVSHRLWVGKALVRVSSGEITFDLTEEP